MSDGYRVVDRDGKEHGPISLLELGRMYADGRLTRESYIYEQRIGGWRRLEDVVDMTAIEKLRDKLLGD